MAEFERAIVLEKCPTGIRGFDEISDDGLPKGRPTLICGSAGCGKTLLAMEFLLRGAIQYKEPGVFVSFEETPKDLAQNFSSLGYDLNDMIARKFITMDHIYIERSEIEETGEYDLESLFIRLAMPSIQSRRSGSFSKLSSRSFPGFPMKEFCARNFADSSAICRIQKSSWCGLI